MLKLVFAAAIAITPPALAVETCRGVPMPPQSARHEPTVPFDQYIVKNSVVAKNCGTTLYPKPAACSFLSPTKAQPDRWVILISDNLKTVEEYGCVVIYEKSHLPPNLWGDPAVEATETIQWLADQTKPH